MKKGILWMLLSFLLVAALVLPSCAVDEGEQEEEEEEEEEDEEVWSPYGGTFTGFPNESLIEDPPSPAIAEAHRGSFHWLDFLQERPLVGDIERGPRGTGETAFHALGYIPDLYQKGLLLESWEVSYEKLVWNVRPGIYWAPTEHQSAWMEPRELTAEDIALDIKRFVLSAYKRRFDGLITAEGIHVIDRYKLEIEFERYAPEVLYYLGYEDRAVISPPELELNSPDKWENQVGTGPFMFEEYVIGSHMSLVRNPNYWDTTTINGVEYQMPFIDRIVLPIIPDAATRLVALKTGLVDFSVVVPPEQWSLLDIAAPELQKMPVTGGAAARIVFRCDEPPFDDVEVRRAMLIGTNLIECMKLWMAAELPMHWFPTLPGNPAYVPMEELPSDIRILYNYNPDLAMDMLEDALGPPDADGVFLKINLTTGSFVPKYVDTAALLKDQWAKIGVEVTIDPREQVDFTRVKYSHPPLWTGAVFDYYQQASPYLALSMSHYTGVDLNYGEYSNPVLDALIDEMGLELDVAEQSLLIKEGSLILMRDVASIPASLYPQRIYWWPWLKNYYGERTIQDDCCFSAILPYIWIDQDLKAEMGY